MGLFTRSWEKNEDRLKVLENVTKVLLVCAGFKGYFSGIDLCLA